MVHPLLFLSERRIAEEIKRARQADEDERVWRRKLAGVGVGPLATAFSFWRAHTS